MSMDAGSSRSGRTNGNKTDKSRRCWSNREEKTLVAAMKELVALGWKGENGFRAGYLNKLEDLMRKEFPNTDLKAQPHINSRVTTWKKNYGSLLIMFARSGCGYNHITKKIECEDDLWESIVDNDPNARTMRNKEWPIFEDWKEIFGKDRATGETAEDVMDAVNEMLHEENTAQAGMGGENENMDDVPEIGLDDVSCGHSEKSSPSSRLSGRKRKISDGVAEIYELMAQMCRSTDERLEKLTMRIGYEYDLGEAKKRVFQMLSSIPSLSIDQKFDVCEILASKTERLEIFLGLPEDARPHYVQRILGSN